MSKKAFNKTSQRDKQRSKMPTENKHEVFASIAIEAIKNIAEVYKHGQIHPSKTTTTYSSKSSAQTSDTYATASSNQRVEKEGSCSSGKGKSQTIEKATIAAVALAAGIFGTAWIYEQEQTRRKAKGGNAEGEGNERDDEDNEDLKEERIPSSTTNSDEASSKATFTAALLLFLFGALSTIFPPPLCTFVDASFRLPCLRKQLQPIVK